MNQRDCRRPIAKTVTTTAGGDALATAFAAAAASSMIIQKYALIDVRNLASAGNAAGGSLIGTFL